MSKVIEAVGRSWMWVGILLVCSALLLTLFTSSDLHRAPYSVVEVEEAVLFEAPGHSSSVRHRPVRNNKVK